MTCSVRQGHASKRPRIQNSNDFIVNVSSTLENQNSLVEENVRCIDPNLTFSGNPSTNSKRTFHSYLSIDITDTGIGMDEKSKKQLFTKFGTNLWGNTINVNGLGLGLYLSKEICRKLGGDIVCKSQKGIGSTFTIKIPWDAKLGLNKLFDKGIEDKNVPQSARPIFRSFAAPAPVPFEIESPKKTKNMFDEFAEKKSYDNLKYDFQSSIHSLKWKNNFYADPSRTWRDLDKSNVFGNKSYRFCKSDNGMMMEKGMQDIQNDSNLLISDIIFTYILRISQTIHLSHLQ